MTLAHAQLDQPSDLTLDPAALPSALRCVVGRWCLSRQAAGPQHAPGGAVRRLPRASDHRPGTASVGPCLNNFLDVEFLTDGRSSHSRADRP